MPHPLEEKSLNSGGVPVIIVPLCGFTIEVLEHEGIIAYDALLHKQCSAEFHL